MVASPTAAQVSATGKKTSTFRSTVMNLVHLAILKPAFNSGIGKYSIGFKLAQTCKFFRVLSASYNPRTYPSLETSYLSAQANNLSARIKLSSGFFIRGIMIEPTRKAPQFKYRLCRPSNPIL